MPRLRILFVLLVAPAIALAIAGCSHNTPAPEANPEVLAALHAQLRVVHGETTWVTHGRGYELVGRTGADLAAVQPALERASAFLAQVYPHDSLAPVVATVRRASAPGKPYIAAAPTPADISGTLVELVLPGGDPIAPAVRAWLSARAQKLSAPGADATGAGGHVPGWSVEMIAAVTSDDAIDEDTKSFAAHMETLIPLSRYFTMDRPDVDAAGRRGRGTGETQPDAGRSGGGGSGGTRGGGMGGGRGGMGGGRGGRMGGGAGGRGGAAAASSERRTALQGPALFTAESGLLRKYLARSGPEIIGQLIDARITGKPIDDVLTSNNLGTVEQLDTDWRAWLKQRADAVNRAG